MRDIVTICSTSCIRFKDGASFSYCPYVLCISGLVRVFRFFKEFAHGTMVFFGILGKTDFIKGYRNLKRKFGVTTHFSEIIELKFLKKENAIHFSFVF